MTPTVSVIVPNYNHAAFLRQRIDSILQQTYQDFEVLILDDCSTDNSQSIIREYAQRYPDIRIYFNQKNSGSPFRQWNKGVKLARGKYVWIAESDDYADAELLDRLVTCLDQQEQIGVAYCQSYRVDETGQITGNMKHWTDELDTEHWRRNYTNNGRVECRDYLSRKSTIPNASAVVFRRQIYLEAGMADERFKMSGDWFLWIKLLINCDICFIADSLNYFRAHSGTTRQYHDHDRVLLKVREEYQIMEYIQQHISLTDETRRLLSRELFKRSFEICPIRLKFSPRFLEFVRIVQKYDTWAIPRIVWAIFRQAVTYIPEKLFRP